MSRKGRIPVALPKGVEVKVTGKSVSVKGPKGTLTRELEQGIVLNIEPSQVLVSSEGEGSDARRFHGLYHALITNMIVGASTGFERRLEMVGVGYRAAVQGNLLDLQIGFSHPTKLPIPQGLQVKVDKNTLIIITGVDKQAVGQFAAQVRAMRPPEPYQGKGIRYEGEYVRRKAGKAAKTAK